MTMSTRIVMRQTLVKLVVRGGALSRDGLSGLSHGLKQTQTCV